MTHCETVGVSVPCSGERCSADSGMSEQYTYGFVVALTFDTACNKTMPPDMKFHGR